MSKRFLTTPFGRIAYLEAGPADAPPVLFVHGIPTSGWLWRHVIRLLEDRFRCYAPDLMGLGDTEVSATAPLDMDAQAEMLADLMTRLGHERFSLVCHDQGGAAGQILAARVPGRIEALVLSDVVCYDNWPVPAIARLQALARLPLVTDTLARIGAFDWIESRTPLSAFRRGFFEPARVAPEVVLEYLRPLRESREGRERFKRFLLAGDARTTLGAVPGLRAFDRPTLIIWAADDRYISPSWGKKLFDEIPGAERFELIPFTGHFWPEENPAAFAAPIRSFLLARAVEASKGKKTALPVIQ